MHRNRVKVTLSNDATVAIRRLSLASGESMSGLIASLFDPNIPVILELSELLEKAAKLRADLPESARDVFRSAVSHISDNIEPCNPRPAPPSFDDDEPWNIEEARRRTAAMMAENQAIEPENDFFAAGERPLEVKDFRHELEPWELEELRQMEYEKRQKAYE